MVDITHLDAECLRSQHITFPGMSEPRLDLRDSKGRVYPTGRVDHYLRVRHLNQGGDISLPACLKFALYYRWKPD